MKKLSVFLVLVLCLTLCGCPLAVQDALPSAKDVHITAGGIEPGMTVKDVFVEVTVDGQPVACRLELTALTNDGYYIMAEDEPVQEGFLARLDIYYSLPEGVGMDQVNVITDCDDGVYDGTGSVGSDGNGCVEAWSHILYGKAKNASMIHTVHIRVGAMYPGMTVADADAVVTVDDQPTDSRIVLAEYSEEGVREKEGTEIIPENTVIQVNVYYYLDQGLTLDNIDVYMDFPDGAYGGTDAVGAHADGRVEARSYAVYGEEPQEPTQSESEIQTHTHEWVEQTGGYVYINCTADREVTYICTCGETKTETVPAPGHDLKEPSVTPPTCTEIGRETTSCRRCGAGFVIETPATGHQWSGWAYANGRVHKRTCGVCGAEEEASHNVPAGDVICTDCGEAIIN